MSEYLTVKELKAFLELVPDDATIEVHTLGERMYVLGATFDPDTQVLYLYDGS